jgi:Raf kinase inhibitor-like YbhB/YbcL family protein
MSDHALEKTLKVVIALSLVVTALVLNPSATTAQSAARKSRIGAIQSSAKMSITSPAFSNGGTIPNRYTCFSYDNKPSGIVPPLTFSGVPAKAKRLVLVMWDPDGGNFVHWVTNIVKGSPAWAGITEGQSKPWGLTAGVNDLGLKDYAGPCPPNGTHRYNFALYALTDTKKKSFGNDA